LHGGEPDDHRPLYGENIKRVNFFNF
jgi:hypothetical protein